MISKNSFMYEFQTTGSRDYRSTDLNKWVQGYLFLRKHCSGPECRGKSRVSGSKFGFTLKSRCLRMICVVSQYALCKPECPTLDLNLFASKWGDWILFLISVFNCNVWWCSALKSLSLQFFNLKKCEVFS